MRIRQHTFSAMLTGRCVSGADVDRSELPELASASPSTEFSVAPYHLSFAAEITTHRETGDGTTGFCAVRSNFEHLQAQFVEATLPGDAVVAAPIEDLTRNNQSEVRAGERAGSPKIALVAQVAAETQPQERRLVQQTRGLQASATSTCVAGVAAPAQLRLNGVGQHSTWSYFSAGGRTWQMVGDFQASALSPTARFGVVVDGNDHHEQRLVHGNFPWVRLIFPDFPSS